MICFLQPLIYIHHKSYTVKTRINSRIKRWLDVPITPHLTITTKTSNAQSSSSPQIRLEMGVRYGLSIVLVVFLQCICGYWNMSSSSVFKNVHCSPNVNVLLNETIWTRVLGNWNHQCQTCGCLLHFVISTWAWSKIDNCIPEYPE